MLTWGSIFRSTSAFTSFPWVGTGRSRPLGPVPGGTLRRRAPPCPGAQRIINFAVWRPRSSGRGGTPLPLSACHAYLFGSHRISLVFVRTAYKCRAYPDPVQASVLNRTFGCVRVVWNQTLAWRHQRYHAEKAGTNFTQANAYLTAMKTGTGLAWLNEVSSVPPQQAIRHQQAAYTAFFAKRARYPRFKSRNGRQSAEYTRSGFRYRNGRLHLAKMDTPLAFTWSWPDVDPASIDPTTVTVSRDPCGRWYVWFAVDVPGPDPFPAAGRVAGVDLGIKDFAVTSDGQRIPNPRHLERKARNLARYQRRMARCQQGSANRAKARAKVARPPESPRRPHRLPPQGQHPPGPRPRRDRPGRPRREEHGPQPLAGEGDLGLRVGHLPGHDRVQGRQIRAARDHSRPVVPLVQDVLCVRVPPGYAEPGYAALDVPLLRHPARPGPQRREEHPGGRSCRSRGHPRPCLRS